MTIKEKQLLEPVIESTRCKLADAGLKGALIVGRDERELSECIKDTWLGLLTDEDLGAVKDGLLRIEQMMFLRKKRKTENPTQLYLFT